MAAAPPGLARNRARCREHHPEDRGSHQALWRRPRARGAPISSSARANMSPSWATTAPASPPSCARSPASRSRPAARSISTARRWSSSARSTAREAGIETVFQNLALADDLDVPSNLFLGREKFLLNLGPFSILNGRAMRERDAQGAGADRREDPQSQQHDPPHVGRPAAMRGDRRARRPSPRS